MNGGFAALAVMAATAVVPGQAAAAVREVTSVRPISGPVEMPPGCGAGKAENTPQIAVDPHDPSHLAVTFALDAGNAVVAASSHNAGATWARTLNPGTVLCNGGPWHERFDPDLQFAPDGRLYASESFGRKGRSELGTDGSDFIIATAAPGSDKLGAPVPVVAPDPLMSAQRGLLAFDPDRPGFAEVLTERLPYIGTYLPVFSSLQLAATTNGGRSFHVRTIYTTPAGTGAVAEGLIRRGRTVLAFAERINIPAALPSLLAGADRADQAVVLRSVDDGAHFSGPALVAPHVSGGDGVRDCCLFRPVASPDGVIYWPLAVAGSVVIYRSKDLGRSWQALPPVTYPGGVSEPSLAAGQGGSLGLSVYELSNAALSARVHVLTSGDGGQRWHDHPIGAPFAIASLGPVDDTSQLGPVQGIAATPTGFAAAMTVGGGLVSAGGGADIDLFTVGSPPQTTLRSIRTRAARDHRKGRAIARFSSSGGGGRASFECSIDRHRFTRCKSPARFALAAGRHRIRVRARTPAGGVDPTPAVRRFKVRRRH